MDFEQLPRSALIRLLQEHEAASRDAGKDGIVMSYTGRTAPWQIIRQVKPKLSNIIKKYSVGEEVHQAQNELWDGENLSAMVTLYKHRGQVDLIVTDPPYNTGEDFRYNDKWDKDPNDPELGDLVPKDDGSRHSKWLKFMTPRVWMMREMLKPGGVIAICIDHRELYRLGMLMDEIFKEENRIGIINWQKAYSPKSDTGGKKGGVSTATEYVLVYAKDVDRAKTQLLDRTDEMNARYSNDDGDPEGDWASDNPSGPGAATHRKMVYAIQSPFTGAFPTFADGSPDTYGQAHVASQVIDLKDLGAKDGAPNWTAEGHTNPVRLRWLVNTALRSRSNRALAVSDFKDQKFDVRVQVQSNANKAADKVAREIVQTYFQQAELVYETVRPFRFGVMRVPKNAPAFTNGLYERYSGLNKFELPFAHALDKVGNTWHRNPSAGGFHIPLLSEGDTASFYPDFIVWKGNMVYCLDTKGSHLLSDAVARKLFDIQDGGKTMVQVRFISEGKQTELRGKAIKGGYTVWKMKSGSPTPIHVDDLDKAVKECLK